jgi:hypothetical protein
VDHGATCARAPHDTRRPQGESDGRETNGRRHQL